MSPKSLLRHKRAVSKVSEMAEGTTFHRVLWDDREGNLLADKQIKRVVLCTGKVYYDLLEEAQKRAADDIYIMRMEQLYPFPEHGLTQELKRFPNADIVWCQEEPRNMGAWTFLIERLSALIKGLGHKKSHPEYVGRPAAAAPATGLMSKHLKQQAQLVDTALTLPATKAKSKKVPSKKIAAKLKK
jgi:2-oxoglutarate dehydrogenase E1 component